MFSELFKRCLLGDRIASTQLFLQIILHQRLENFLQRMGLEPKLMILPTPQPGPPSFELGKAISERKLIKALRELPRQEESVFPKQIQLEAWKKMKQEVEQLLKEIDQEMRVLK